MNPLQRLFPPAPPAVEIELTAQLLGGGTAIKIIAVIAAVVGLQAALNSDWASAALLFSITLVAILRALWMRRLRMHSATPSDLATARQWERGYALGSFATSLLIGGVNLLALSYRDVPVALLIVCTLCCYIFSLVVRTAVRPRVCLLSAAITLVLTLAGLPVFVTSGSRLDPAAALAALATVAAVLVLSSVQLTAHLYRTTLNQLLAQRDLVRFARQDPLTGLDNRLALREHFDVLLPGPMPLVALLYVDLDAFKPVNDLHGHRVGDDLLCAVADRLRASLQVGERVFRMGGDEFVVLSRVHHRKGATAIARRLLLSISRPYAIAALDVRISASIGVALAKSIEADLDALTADADAALYDAKRSGGTFRFAKDAATLQMIA